jgi:hypothetical protein
MHQIPEHELPQTLIVHDPWNLLEATGRIGRSDVETPWMEERDVVRRYKLQRTSVPEDELKFSKDIVDPEANDFEYRFITRGDLFNPFNPVREKPVLAKCPPKPTRKSAPSEAHLYLSPAHALGIGNHSFVYKAELDVPRTMFVEPQLCDRCLEEAVAEYCALHREEVDGDFQFVQHHPRHGHPREDEDVEEEPFSEPDVPEEWIYSQARDMDKADREFHAKRVGCKQEHLLGGEERTSETEELARAQISGGPVLDANGEVVHQRSIGHNFLRLSNRKYSAKITIRDILHQGLVMRSVTHNSLESAMKAESQGDKPEDAPETVLRDPRMEHIIDYNGAVIELDLTNHPKVRWQSPDLTGPFYCEHLDDRFAFDHPISQTARVTVAAKLSIRHDVHLEREARNYTRFPSHFFEDWTGYNYIDKTIGPTPVHAVVPRFYGYYLPEQEPRDKGKYYLSPIMLIENCGTPINPKELSQEEK